MVIKLEALFWGHEKFTDGAAVSILNIEKEFANAFWRFNAIYLCNAGIIIDYCKKIKKEDILKFMDNVTSNQAVNDEDSPFTFDQRTSLKADGRQLEFSHGCGTSINPYYDNPEKHLELPDSIIEMYKFGGSDCGWVLTRDLHLWNGDPITDPKKIEISLSATVREDITITL